MFFRIIDAILIRLGGYQVAFAIMFFVASVSVPYQFGFKKEKPLASKSNPVASTANDEPQPASTHTPPEAGPKGDPVQLERKILGSGVPTTRSLGEELVAAADKLTDASKKWRELTLSVSNSEVGMKLATDTDRLPLMMKVLEDCNSIREDVSKLLDRASQTAEDLATYQRDYPDGEITKTTQAAIDGLLRQLSSFSEQLDSGREEYENWIEKNENVAPGGRTLREAMITYKREEKEKELEAKFAVQEEVKRENAARLLAEERKRQEAEQRLKELATAQETERLQTEAKAIENQKEADRILAEAKRKQAILESEFTRDRSRIQHYLGPLFIKTTKQPGGTSLIETKEAKPVSLSALKSAGMSNPDVSKACTSLLLFFSYFGAGDRGQGPYPKNYHGGALSPEQLSAIRPAYDLLDKYGDLLVEKGLLAE